MVLSRLAASGLLLLALLALSVDGKPVQQWAQSWPGPNIPPLLVQQWAQKWPSPKVPPLTVQQWAPLQKWAPLLQPHESPAGGTTALREELSLGPEAASGVPSAGAEVGRSGSKAPAAPHRLSKSKGAAATSAASRPMRDLRPDGKQARQNWGRMVHHDHHDHHHDHHAAVGGGGGGGGGGGARRLKGLAKKGAAKGCFGLKLDRIGTMSGLGC
uniref:BATXBPP13 n=1 Tax=Bothrops atrox TaxID=8725 RepID=A0A1L8D665_BOTAT